MRKTTTPSMNYNSPGLEPGELGTNALAGRPRSRTLPAFRMIKRFPVAVICMLLIFASPAAAEDKKPASQKEESYMFGRILAVIQDSGGGFKREALHKIEAVNKDIEKLQYSTQTVWRAHYWYAKVLLQNRDRKKAAKIILLAQQDAQSLTAQEQKDTEELRQQIESKE